MTYNRMEAKPIAGEHCRFCGDASAPLVQTRVSAVLCCDTAFVSFRGGGRCQVERERFVCAIPTMKISMVARGRAARNAAISGRHAMTKPMRKPDQLAKILRGGMSTRSKFRARKIEL